MKELKADENLEVGQCATLKPLKEDYGAVEKYTGLRNAEILGFDSQIPGIPGISRDIHKFQDKSLSRGSFMCACMVVSYL
jgi:hypothetical protein